MGKEKAHMTPLVAEELLVTDVFWDKVSYFSLEVGPLVGGPCSKGGPISMCKQTKLIRFSRL